MCTVDVTLQMRTCFTYLRGVQRLLLFQGYSDVSEKTQRLPPLTLEFSNSTHCQGSTAFAIFHSKTSYMFLLII